MRDTLNGSLLVLLVLDAGTVTPDPQLRQGRTSALSLNPGQEHLFLGAPEAGAIPAYNCLIVVETTLYRTVLALR